jgi:hypothetical protein
MGPKWNSKNKKLQANVTVLEFGSVGWHLDADTQAVPWMIANEVVHSVRLDI